MEEICENRNISIPKSFTGNQNDSLEETKFSSDCIERNSSLRSEKVSEIWLKLVQQRTKNSDGAIFKTRNGEWEWEWGTRNGEREIFKKKRESLKRGIFKSDNL